MLQVFQTALLFFFPALVIVAGMRDAVSFTIPNWISIALGAAFFPAALAMGASPIEIGLSAAVGFGLLLAGMAMFAVGWIGGGDAKLLAAAGLWLGWQALTPYILITGCAGGALAVGLLTLRSQMMRPILALGPTWVSRLATPGENAPYGIAIAVGALASFPQSLLPILARSLSGAA